MYLRETLSDIVFEKPFMAENNQWTEISVSAEELKDKFPVYAFERIEIEIPTALSYMDGLGVS